VTTYTLFPSASGPGASTEISAIVLGKGFDVTSGGLYLQGCGIWRCDSNQPGSGNYVIWQATGPEAGAEIPSTLISASGEITGQFNYTDYAAAIPLSQGVPYYLQRGLAGYFPDTANYFDSGGTAPGGIVNGPLNGYSDNTGTNADPWGNPNGSFSTVGSDPTAAFASSGNNGYNPWLTPVITTIAPGNATSRLWPTYPKPIGASINSQTIDYTLATQMAFSQAVTPQRLWFYSPPTAAVLPTKCLIYDISTTSIVSGSVNSSPSWSGTAGSGWVSCDYTTSGLNIASTGNTYAPAVYYTGGSEWFVAQTDWWSGGGPGSSGLTWNLITAPSGAGIYNVGDGFPATPGDGENYWVDLEVLPYTAPANVLYQMRLMP
jgi:hypothetical protein